MRSGEDSTPQTPPIWLPPLIHPLPHPVPLHYHTPTLTIITAPPLSLLQRTQKVSAQSKRIMHTAYVAVAAADSHHMLSSCQELEGHLFDGAFSRNLYNVLYSVHLCVYVCVCSVGSALCGNAILGDLLHPRNVSMRHKKSTCAVLVYQLLYTAEIRPALIHDLVIFLIQQ